MEGNIHNLACMTYALQLVIFAKWEGITSLANVWSKSDQRPSHSTYATVAWLAINDKNNNDYDDYDDNNNNTTTTM